jgi:membrane-bound lytic murein transglycosylase D
MSRPIRALPTAFLLLIVGLPVLPGQAGSEPLPTSLSAPHAEAFNDGATGLSEHLGLTDSSVKQSASRGSSETVSPLEFARDPWPETVSLPASLEEGPGVVPRSYRIEDNARVRQFLDQFQTGYRRAVVERWLVRAGRYLPMVFGVFREKGLPEELVFTAMIESGFNPIAVSRAGAKGLWQFMAPTARRYGLRVDRWVDERLDPEKSTVAAANYLRDLYTMFGSWELVQAAYNAGEMKVTRAIQGMGTTDFWALARGRLLRQETKDFVPAIHAATLIGREPERYGFVVAPEDPLRYEIVTVTRATPLPRIAAQAGVALEELERLNPELRLKQTPPGPYALKVPVGGADHIQTALERALAPRHIASARPQGKTHLVKAAAALAPQIHVVQPRETLSTIAKRYGVSLKELLHWNGLAETARIFPGDRLRVALAVSRAEESEQGGFH